MWSTNLPVVNLFVENLQQPLTWTAVHRYLTNRAVPCSTTTSGRPVSCASPPGGTLMGMHSTQAEPGGCWMLGRMMTSSASRCGAFPQRASQYPSCGWHPLRARIHHTYSWCDAVVVAHMYGMIIVFAACRECQCKAYVGRCHACTHRIWMCQPYLLSKRRNWLRSTLR